MSILREYYSSIIAHRTSSDLLIKYVLTSKLMKRIRGTYCPDLVSSLLELLCHPSIVDAT
jgi:hypothetical protein